MVTNAEKLGGPLTAGDAPRITKVGKVIMKFNLDDPPQPINVFREEAMYILPLKCQGICLKI